ncbi:MAG: acyl-CoA carboxylase subunit beta [Nitrospirota bacterium]
MAGGGEERVKKHRETGKMTARERLNLLFDEGTFQELDMYVTHRCTDFGMADKHILGDGVVTGTGMIHGRLVHAYAHDFTVFGGSASEANGKKICKVMDLATKLGTPLVSLNDSGGARIQEGVLSLAGLSGIFLRNTKASGVIPQISAIMGPCAGGAVYSPALTDFIVMVKEKSHMFLTGPDVIKTVTHEDVTKEDLGGAATHNTTSGVAHFMTNDDSECIALIRELLTFLPQNNIEESPIARSSDDPSRKDPKLNDLIPDDPRSPYDVRELINIVVDDNYFFEIQELYAKNMVTGFARLNGKSVGIIANQPMVLAGSIDTYASRKAGRFIRFCDAFNIPIITFEDVPGFLPGKEQELNGIIRDGAKLLYAYCEATVPKICVVTRKAYGGAYIVMSSKNIGSDYNFAYPGAEIAVMGPEGAVNILCRKEVAEADDPDAVKQEKINEYKDKFANPYVAASLGFIDEVILPEETRRKLIMALDRTMTKAEKNPPKKHGNIPQ